MKHFLTLAARRRLHLWLIPFISLASFSISSANSDMRNWALASGESYRAELVSYDEAKKCVVLRTENQEELRLDHDAFSAFDRAWLLEWTEFGEESKAKLEKLGGTLSRHTSKGKFTTEYSLYQPPLDKPAAGTKPPMLILFYAGGRGHREIMRYAEAAKAVGLTIVSCEYFRNGEFTNVETGQPETNDALLARFNELLLHVEANVPHDEKRMFMGGCSGGAWRAFHYSAQVNRPWAGIYSNCGWLGGEVWYDLPYPKMRVAMVNGDKDPAGTYHQERDTERLMKAGCKITLHAFEGAHQVAPASVQEKAFRWLLSDE